MVCDKYNLHGTLRLQQLDELLCKRIKIIVYAFRSIVEPYLHHVARRIDCNRPPPFHHFRVNGDTLWRNEKATVWDFQNPLGERPPIILRQQINGAVISYGNETFLRVVQEI